MLTPYRQDTNSLYLTEPSTTSASRSPSRPSSATISTHLTSAARIAIARADIIIFSGGLGPTEDDLTREAVAAALGLTLRRDNELLTNLAKRFAARRMAMPPNNLRQTDVLDGARILPNPNGSAPGQYLDTTVPGPDGTAYPQDRHPPPRPAQRAQAPLPGRLSPPARPLPAPALPGHPPAPHGPHPGVPGGRPHRSHLQDLPRRRNHHPRRQRRDPAPLFSAQGHPAEAQARVDELTGQIEQEMGDAIFSSNGDSLEEIVLLNLGMRHLTLAAAESCTGGLLASASPPSPAAPRAFRGGAVVYTEEMKTLFCDVPPELIDTHGAVSPEVARALAEGIRRRAGTSLGIAITGLAGPGGGAPGPDQQSPSASSTSPSPDEQDTQVKRGQPPRRPRTGSPLGHPARPRTHPSHPSLTACT